MQRPNDSQDEPQGEEHAVPPEGAGSTAEARNVATDKTETTSMPQVENRASNEEGSKLESAAYNESAVNSPQAKTPLKTLGPTPITELCRRPEIYIADLFPSDCCAVEKDNYRRRQSHYLPAMPAILYRLLILPTGPSPYGSTRELFNSIVGLLRNHVMLPEKQCSLLAYWSIATWFPDFLPFLPSVTVTGPASGADLLLRTLVAVCRRPVLLV